MCPLNLTLSVLLWIPLSSVKSWWWSKKDVYEPHFILTHFQWNPQNVSSFMHILSATYFISADVHAIVLLGFSSAHRCLHSCFLFQRGFSTMEGVMQAFLCVFCFLFYLKHCTVLLPLNKEYREKYQLHDDLEIFIKKYQKIYYLHFCPLLKS